MGGGDTAQGGVSGFQQRQGSRYRYRYTGSLKNNRSQRSRREVSCHVGGKLGARLGGGDACQGEGRQSSHTMFTFVLAVVLARAF